MNASRPARAALAAAAVIGALATAAIVHTQHASAAGGNPAILEPANGALLGAWAKPRSGRTAEQELAWDEQQLGRPFDIYHVYYHVRQPLPTNAMVTAAASGHTILMAFDPDPVNSTPVWQEIWRGDQDATLIKRAQELKSFGRPVMLNFDHEADANVGQNGTAADYVKAYRHVHDLFASQGATNVIWVWDMRGSLFTNPAAADAMYPGDAYVDWVAADAYDWYPGKPGSAWRSFADAFGPFHAWAAQEHPAVPQMAEETGVQEDTATPDALRKAQWISDMAATVKSWPQMKALVWFNSNQVYPWWYDTSGASMSAFRALAQDCYFDTRAASCNGSAGDTSPPTAPGGLTASNLAPSSFTVSWSPSTDDTGVVGYDVYVAGALEATTAGTSATIAGIDCSGGCTVGVRARDAAGNVSSMAAITVTTPAPSAGGSSWNLTAAPAATQVRIRFSLPEAATVSLQILDADTAVVTHKLSSVALAAGQHIYYWQRKDDHGVAVPAGSYVARLIVQTASGPVVADVPFTVG